ncbi:MAG: hypothetical protein ACLRPW_10655 [Intestinibacter sp.]
MYSLNSSISCGCDYAAVTYDLFKKPFNQLTIDEIILLKEIGPRLINSN